MLKRFAALIRTMSTTTSTQTPTLHLFFVYAPDKTEEGTLARRFSVRPSHIEAIQDNITKGVIRVGGMLTTPQSIASPAAERKVVGSTMIIKAETIEEVEKLIQGDIYYTAGVWDPEKIVILPFFAATPFP